MSIQITSDSTCDLSPALLQSYGVRIIPLSVIQGGTSYKDGVDIQPADIFAHVEQGGDLPTTSAVSVGEYRALFAELSPQHEAVVHITISADFSSCYQNACIAAEEFGNVYVVDSRNLSTGHGLVVVEAALAARRGMAPDELVPFLRELTGRVEASFLIDRLDYMVKGGRCSAVAMLGANLLRLKPCIEVRDGKMGVVKKYRGAFAKCLVDYVRERLEGRTDLVPDRVFITHTTVAPETVAAVRQAVEQYGPFAEILETDAGCTVSSHCGPGTLGILFIRKA
ncbi:MAG TPA: DegV family protein [Candidatus Galloscillospira excrementavium]|nr:DegV family protein [Candidatus Galloscillospira excrementavium]